MLLIVLILQYDVLNVHRDYITTAINIYGFYYYNYH
nr:MAG TPA: hypothetical protein [Crassvirales sp.]